MSVDVYIREAEANMNAALDDGDYMAAAAYLNALRSYRLGRDNLFTCSIHEIDGVYDFDTGRGE